MARFMTQAPDGYLDKQREEEGHKHLAFIAEAFMGSEI